MQIPYILQLIIPTIPLLVIACTGNVPKIDVSPPYNSELLNPTKTQTTTTPNKPKISLTKTSDLELTEFISSIPSTHFVKPVHFDPFPVNLQQKFKAAVDIEFASAPQKAGISVAVYTDGTLWTYAKGNADENIAMSTETPLLIGSTSKTFLSAIVLGQIENGNYNLTDSIGDLLREHPDFPSFPTDKINPEVTILELLTMSSGLADFSKNTVGKNESFKQPSWNPSDSINLVPSEYDPPGKFQYNDTNVVLLGLIAEFYSGKTLADLFRETYFTPLNISAITLPEEGIPWHSGIFNDPASHLTVPNIAMPYTDLSAWSSGFGNMIKAAPFEFGYYIGAVGRLRYACCGIVSTPANVAQWAYQLYSTNGSLLSTSTQAQLLMSFSDKRVPAWAGKNSDETYGYLSAKRTFHLYDGSRITAYGHPGGGGGYHSLMRYSPELDLSISILSNSEMKFRGSCGTEKLANCIAISLFSGYSESVQKLSP
tara:strand:- start:6058 stop:7509 length:1452 start_codon:yes stop_codon:yes gene_type:complete